MVLSDTYSESLDFARLVAFIEHVCQADLKVLRSSYYYCLVA